ncbi:hypothetical protein NHQ30_001420 [Ciborinia camelliae]|nr:hypothetical protein NHQ30_001420 [Ciborinia camelliae]
MDTLVQNIRAQLSIVDGGKSREAPEAPKCGKPEGIYARSVDCMERFQYAIQSLKGIDSAKGTERGYDTKKSLSKMKFVFAMFNRWGNESAAFEDAALRSSLEFRLEEASEVKQRVLKILSNLQVSLHEAALIIIGKKPNETWPVEGFSDSDEDEGLDVEFEQTSELQELFQAMKDANSNLMKLSMVIPRSPSQDDYLKAATRYHFDPCYDIGHVREKHGSAKGITDWLIVRLGEAITRRRQYLKYRQDHGKLMRDWDEAAITEREHDTIPLTKATTFGENTTPVQKGGSELGSILGSQTSYKATILGEAAGRLNVPSHPKMAFEDVPFEFGRPFTCPYCFTEQVVKNRSAWKKHVFGDLRPYVCTFQQCDMMMFSSRNEWFSHELLNHRREWACQQCQHSPFSSSSAYEIHLQSEHNIEFEGSQLKALMLQSEEPVDKISATACQLCDEWESIIKDKKNEACHFPHGGQPSQPYGTCGQFRRHLGQHMEQLALFALSMDEDPTEDDSGRRG